MRAVFLAGNGVVAPIFGREIVRRKAQDQSKLKI